MPAHKGRVLLDFLPNPEELSTPLKIDLEEAYGFGLFMLEAILRTRQRASPAASPIFSAEAYSVELNRVFEATALIKNRRTITTRRVFRIRSRDRYAIPGLTQAVSPASLTKSGEPTAASRTR
jgi:hypothetical protein